jgi:hypothetical protein
MSSRFHIARSTACWKNQDSERSRYWPKVTQLGEADPQAMLGLRHLSHMYRDCGGGCHVPATPQVRGIECRASSMLGKHSTMSPVLFSFESGPAKGER